MKILVAFAAVTLVSGCGMSGSENNFSGIWVSKESNMKTRELKLDVDGGFEVKGFPSAIACSDSTAVGDVDGTGTWEYEAQDDRVFLKFSSMTNQKCSTPYGVMIFHQPGNKLAAFPDVEKPSSAVIFDLVGDGKKR
ncbi:hypothetical protein [Xanthomonas bundabergensis]|uniref:hypothetical protein n=1 Tax=Xanthomonas bundabergensis TaxID=3160842 RepID=UPI0035151D4D